MDNILFIDSRESRPTKQKFQLMSEDYPDLNIEIKALKTFDYENQYMGIEFKNINDFVSSFTEKIIRKDGSKYLRLESQINRMLNTDKQYRMLMIYGNIEDLHSNIHLNSVYGQLASIYCKGIDIIWIPQGTNYPEVIYRLHRKSLKYGPERMKKE